MSTIINNYVYLLIPYSLDGLLKDFFSLHIHKKTYTLSL